MHQGEPEPGKRVLERGVGPRGDGREIGAYALDGVLVAVFGGFQETAAFFGGLPAVLYRN